MTAKHQNGSSILIGYEWRQAVQVTPADLFPVGGEWKAQVRAIRAASTVLAEMTTDGGGIERVSDGEITMVLTAAQTAAMKAGSVILDVVRTDVTPPEHLGFTLTVPVQLPVTRS